MYLRQVWPPMAHTQTNIILPPIPRSLQKGTMKSYRETFATGFDACAWTGTGLLLLVKDPMPARAQTAIQTATSNDSGTQPAANACTHRYQKGLALGSVSHAVHCDLRKWLS